jgi:NitT/TauT family transport system substrate-binding protein
MKKLLSMSLAVLLAFSLFSCAGKTASGDTSEVPSASAEAAPSQSPGEKSPEPSPSPSPSPVVEEPSPTAFTRLGFLKGPTGIGAASLMAANDAVTARGYYDITLESDPQLIASALIAGTLDIAAVPTNLAATLYNKTNGNIKIIAINTLGVLNILEQGDTVDSVADLHGKTLYATGQGANPEYVLNYILRKNGLEPGRDITIEYMDSAELATKAAAGEIDLCLLPVPNSTSVLMKNPNMHVAVDLNAEWLLVSGVELTQGCVVVRADLPDIGGIVSLFLDDYRDSIEFMSDPQNIDQAAALAARYEIVGSEPVAKAAIPESALVFISGADYIKTVIEAYYQMMFEADPASLGGKIPDDAFYY